MKNLVAFFEIPATDFGRAVKFYETIFGIEMPAMDYETEKMAFFPNNSGAISWAKDFNPSKDGVIVSLACNDMEKSISLIEINGGKVVIPKTAIQAECGGYFCTFIDSEGNRLGLWSEQ